MQKSVLVLLTAAMLSIDPVLAADVMKGAFHGGNYAPRDTASGSATLVKLDGGTYELRFDSNFTTTPGPDLFVYLSASADPQDAHAITDNASFEVGKLASPSGKQELSLPKNFDPKKFKSVAIWCKQYRILFGAAALKKHE